MPQSSLPFETASIQATGRLLSIGLIEWLILFTSPVINCCTDCNLTILPFCDHLILFPLVHTPILLFHSFFYPLRTSLSYFDHCTAWLDWILIYISAIAYQKASPVFFGLSYTNGATSFVLLR